MTIRNNERYTSVETTDRHVVLHCESGKHFRADLLLWANGRTGNTAGMGLEALGIAVNHRGQVEVDDHFQTSVEGVYAVGDVIRGPMLAHKAEEEGVACVEQR